MAGWCEPLHKNADTILQRLALVTLFYSSLQATC